MRRLMLVVMVGLVLFTTIANAQFAFNEASQNQMVMTNMAAMPLTFTENQGQWNEKAKFKANAGGATFWFCSDEIAYVFTRDTDELLEDDGHMMHDMPDMPDKFDRPRYKKESLVIRAQLIGANPNAEIVGENRLSHNCNYFYGNEPSKWRTDVPNYSTITYKDIYPGIDLKYHGNGQGMKYDFIVNPGADISQIQIRYEGADNLAITPNGDLEASTSFGPIHENIPSVYQEIGSSKREVTGRYVITAPGVFGFEVDDYNPSITLVIDPELVYSTYLGGGGDNDFGYAIAVDASGSAYVTGYTTSSDFPTENPYDESHNGERDVFVAKLSPAGNSLIYSTFLGGVDLDEGYGIAADASGNAYITGYTGSSDFPMENPYDGSYNGSHDAFVTKLSPAGNSLIYSTYLGGNGWDFGQGIVVDANSSAYVTGRTESSDFPTENPYQTHQGYYDVFVTKLSPEGNSLVYSTYLGGSNGDHGYDIAANASGNAYITGYTGSSDFPTENPYQTHQGYHDVFVTKLSPSGNSLIYSTYLGGNGYDYGRGIAIDGSGNAYVTGYVNSPNFPTLNPYQTYPGAWDIFVSKLSPEGNSLVYSTYLGGSYHDRGYAIAVDGSGSAYVTGKTESYNFPILNHYQTRQGPSDAFVTMLAPGGNSLIYSTYLGGNSSENGLGIAVDGNGSTYITGMTSSTDFPTMNPYQLDQGGTDAIIAKFGDGFVSDLGFRPDSHGWRFGNFNPPMWPYFWDPLLDPWDELCLGRCLPYTRCFPTWALFRNAFGRDQTEVFKDGVWVRRPHAEKYWKGVKECWQGSCFGFSISSFLFFDGFVSVQDEFPGYSDLFSVPFGGHNQAIINKLFFYQFGRSQLQHKEDNINFTTPIQTLQNINNMFNSTIRDDMFLAMYNNTGKGGHTVNPYKLETDQYNHDLKYIYIYDSNIPGDGTKRIVVNTASNSWSYDEKPGWGGFYNLFLMDPVSNYMETPILPSSVSPIDQPIITDEMLSESIIVFVSTSVNAHLQSSFGSIGVENDLPFSTLTDGIHITPLTGNETPPIGYYLPNAAWTATVSGIRDSLFHYMIFTNSTVLACYRTPADSIEVEVISYSGNDSSLAIINLGGENSLYSMEKISVWPDSELVFQVNSISISPQDSVKLSITPSSGILLANYGQSTSYDLKIELVGSNIDTAFYHWDISIGANTSQEVVSGENGFISDSLRILIDDGIDGTVDDTFYVENEPLSDNEYLPGDVNMANGIWPPAVIGGDVTYLVNYFKGSGEPCLLDGFWASADANGDCIVMGSDVVRLVNYFRGNGDIEYCEDYPPAWPPVPDDAPGGWPNCELPPVTGRVLPSGSDK